MATEIARFIMSCTETTAPPMSSVVCGTRSGKGCASAPYDSFMPSFRNVLSAMVAMISGSPTFGSIGSTTKRLNRKPSTNTASARPNSSAAQSGSPNHFSPTRTAKPGSTTNSPCAKFTVCAACHRSGNPMAANA